MEQNNNSKSSKKIKKTLSERISETEKRLEQMEQKKKNLEKEIFFLRQNLDKLKYVQEAENLLQQ